MRSEFHWAATVVTILVVGSSITWPVETQSAPPQPTPGDVQAAIAEGIERARSGYIPLPKAPAVTRGGVNTLEIEPQPSATPDDYAADMVLGIRSLQQYWSEALPGLFKRQYRSAPKLYQYVHSQGDNGLVCGKTAPGPRNAIYCPATDTIQWDGSFLYGLYKEFGDFSPVFVVAHEWGHAVQQRLGLISNAVYPIEVELQADCLAGAWTRHAEAVHKILEPGDVDEAIRTLFEVRDPVGTPAFDPSAHGTGQQRIQSFNNGYYAQAGARACVQ